MRFFLVFLAASMLAATGFSRPSSSSIAVVDECNCNLEATSDRSETAPIQWSSFTLTELSDGSCDVGVCVESPCQASFSAGFSYTPPTPNDVVTHEWQRYKPATGAWLFFNDGRNLNLFPSLDCGETYQLRLVVWVNDVAFDGGDGVAATVDITCNACSASF